MSITWNMCCSLKQKWSMSCYKLWNHRKLLFTLHIQAAVCIFECSVQSATWLSLSRWSRRKQMAPNEVQAWESPPISAILRQRSKKRGKMIYFPSYPGIVGMTSMPHKKQWGSLRGSVLESCVLHSAPYLWQMPSLVALSEQSSLKECKYFHSFAG